MNITNDCILLYAEIYKTNNTELWLTQCILQKESLAISNTEEIQYIVSTQSTYATHKTTVIKLWWGLSNGTIGRTTTASKSVKKLSNDQSHQPVYKIITSAISVLNFTSKSHLRITPTKLTNLTSGKRTRNLRLNQTASANMTRLSSIPNEVLSHLFTHVLEIISNGTIILSQFDTKEFKCNWFILIFVIWILLVYQQSYYHLIKYSLKYNTNKAILFTWNLVCICNYYHCNN